MSYGRQHHQPHRPPFQPPGNDNGSGQHRQGGSQRPPQGGLRRETWRPAIPQNEYGPPAPQRGGQGTSGYRQNQPLPPQYPPQQAYEQYPSQPFLHPSRQVQQQASQSQQEQYPDYPPPPANNFYNNDRYAPAPSAPPPISAPRSPGFTPRDPTVFIHPSRRERPPAHASTSAPQYQHQRAQYGESAPASMEGYGNGSGVSHAARAQRPPSPRRPQYPDRHGKGKGRDDSSQDSRSRDAYSSRRHREDEPRRGRSRSRQSSASPVRPSNRDRRRQASRSSSYSRSRSPAPYKRPTSSSQSRSRSPKRPRRRRNSSSMSISRSPSPVREKKTKRRFRSPARTKRRASPSYGSRPVSRSPGRKGSPSLTEEAPARRQSDVRSPRREEVQRTIQPTAPISISLKPANGRHQVHPSRRVALDPEDAFERLAAPAAAPIPVPKEPPSAQVELDNAQREWEVRLADIAPYIQSAFFDWESQGRPMSEVDNFLGHFFRRPPKPVELRLISDLHVHYMRYVEAKIRLDASLPQSELEPEVVAEPLPTPVETVPPLKAAAAPEPATVPSPKREYKPTPKTISTSDTPSSTTHASPRDPIASSAPPAAPDETYQRLAQVGEGTYGKVYKARHVHTGVFVALKRIRMEGEKDGFPVTAMREIKLLQSLQHPNVIRLHEMMISKGSVYMVMQYMDHDLTGLLAQPNLTFTPAHLKSLNYQMLAALAYLHERGILHRDMKGSNILLNASGELKLADFGLARLYNRRKKSDYTNRVITLWYRGPELLLGETVYGPEVDMWSAGCIMLELFTTRPIFQGSDEIHQLEVIYNICGTPSEEEWPRLKDLPWYELVKPKTTVPCRFRESFTKWLSPAALDLAEGLLRYDPAKRLSAAAALEMAYFTSEEPAMEMPGKLLEGRGEHHELTAKQDRARRRQKKEE